jgi:hypothetical protein
MYSDEEFDSNFEKCGKTFVDLRLAEDWQYPERVKRIRIPDVIKYYHKDARNITSGMRSIAGIYGDWRMIDYIAGDVLAYFKNVNVVELRRESRKAGLMPKF